jgi:hypothetical protein
MGLLWGLQSGLLLAPQLWVLQLVQLLVTRMGLPLELQMVQLLVPQMARLMAMHSGQQWALLMVWLSVPQTVLPSV